MSLGLLVKVNENMSKELSSKEDPNVLNVALLVELGREHELNEVVLQLNEGSNGLYGEVSGPWPPYNFVDR